MRIYNEIVFDVDGKVIYEDSYEYSGDVMLLQEFDPDDINKDGTVNVQDIILKQNQQVSVQSVLQDQGGDVTDLMQQAQQTQSMASSILGEYGGAWQGGPTETSTGTAYQEALTAIGSSGNPLPSMPSISNVGAAPFSGVINWNAIPGGFQPLPQIAGGKKKLYQLSQFHGGINQKSSPRDISDKEAQEATNVTVSQVGRIKVLGDLKSSTSTGLTASLLRSSANMNPNAGHGWYIFKSGYSLATIPVRGDYTINVTQDGDTSQLIDNASFTDATCVTTNTDATVTHGDDDGAISIGMKVSGEGIPANSYVKSVTNDTTFELGDTPGGGGSDVNATATADPVTLTFSQSELLLDISSANTHVAPVYYAAGGGLYANDANFLNTRGRMVARLVYRVDQNGTVSGWVMGGPLVESPHQEDTSGGETNAVTLQDASSSDTMSDTAGEFLVNVKPSGTGTWNGTYYFYASWLFDGGCETGLTSIGTDVFDEDTLTLNPSITHSNAAPLGGNKRIEGARIYFKESGTTERYLLAEISTQDGVKGALDSSFIPWEINSDVHDLTDAFRPVFDDPPEVYTYASLNGYYANEVYAKSSDATPDGAGPSPLDVRYKTAVVGQQGNVFIGNVIFNGKVFPDGMMYSMPGKPGVFPKFNFFDSPSSDGSPIMALAAFQDTILQFKENAMYVINISKPAQFYAEASFRDCGVSNQCQVFTTAFGIIFANKNGCFIYDGSKVISLTSGKFNVGDWALAESSSIYDDTADVPSVGYDPRSQSIIVLKNIGHDTNSTAAWVYNMVTKSWTEGVTFIDNAAGDTGSNFQISPNGYLSLIHYDVDDPPEGPYTYNIGEADSNVQTITYITKDIDFGLPSQTKKIFKIYVTYLGNGSSVTVTGGLNGDTTPTQAMTNAENSGATLTNAGTTDHNVATFTIDDHPANVKSIMLKFTGSAVEDFEINDISILYRLRPIK